MRTAKQKLFLSIFFVWMMGIVHAQQGNFEKQADSVLSLMTLEEKAGQLSLFTNDWDSTGAFIKKVYADHIRQGLAGGIFNAHGAAYTRKLQELAVNESRLGIPLIFGFDVIHGHHTIFPIPLAEAASWDLQAIERSARIAAIESSATGLHWTFAPMCDISRDPRWGRVMEGAGEDPSLGSAVAAARVRGFQGDGFAQPDAVMACVKHFAAYGAPQGGREYHSVDMSERMLREVYLPPYKAAVDAGAMSVMTAFNDLNGIPATGSYYLLTDILREEWRFNGFVVTDYNAVAELINHGVAADRSESAAVAVGAGADMDMESACFLESLPQLVRQGIISESLVDIAVRRILLAKFRLGLFEDPYRFCSVEREAQTLRRPDFLEASADMARKSMVLLKNKDQLLPLAKNTKKIAVIGPLADSWRDMLGGWYAAGGDVPAESLLDGIRTKVPAAEILYAPGCTPVDTSRTGFKKAVETAMQAEVVILALGEPGWMAGEATSRTEIGLPGVQQELAEAIYRTGKPVMAVLFNGRPLTIPWLDEHIPAILEAWFPGTKAGTAVADILFGDYNPSGKLPMTFPRSVGQIPLYYSMKNTGRPFDPNLNTSSKYLDSPNEPLYPFGYGLSYSSFSYGEIRTDKKNYTVADSVNVFVDVTNTGRFAGEEVVQFYIQDPVAEVSRPVRELKGFRKIRLEPGQATTVNFTIFPETLSYLGKTMKPTAGKGTIKFYIGGNSRDTRLTQIHVE